MVFSVNLIAQKAGDVARVIKEIDIRENPEASSISYGILPKSTIVQYTGDNVGEFTKVRVELVDGEIEGWVPVSVLGENEKNRDSVPTKDEKAILKPKIIKVPKDELLAIRREKSFIYGLGGGTHFDIVSTNIDENFYLDWGFRVGGILGYHISRYFIGRFEANYSLINATASENQTTLQFGFVELGLLVDYSLWERLSVFGGFQYHIGISLSDMPETLNKQIENSASLSSIYFSAGVGYKLILSEFLLLFLKAKYTMSFLIDPISISTVGIEASLEFGG